MLLETSPFLNINSPAFPIFISCAAIFVTVYFNNRKIRIDMKKDSEGKLEKKASKTYVDQQDRSLHHRINELDSDNKSLSKKIDDNQKFIIERLDSMNTNILNLRK